MYMRKVFIEPDIQKLRVNLHENIASSGCGYPEYHLRFIGRVFANGLDDDAFWVMYDTVAAGGSIGDIIDFLTSGPFASCIIVDEIFSQ